MGVPVESYPGERRVALTPQNAQLLLKKGFKQVLVEAGAGFESSFLDENYKAAGATIVTRDTLFAQSDILLKVRAPIQSGGPVHDGKEIELIRDKSTLISFVWPAQNPQLVEQMKQKQLTTFAMDSIPRISRAQVFDALR